MSSLPWICRQCLPLVRRPLRVRQLRYSSTVTSNGSIPPVLFNRARLMAIEHAQLNEQISTDFDPKLARRAGELQGVAAALKQVDDATEELAELRTMLADPSTDNELKELAAEDVVSIENRLEEVSQQLITELTPKHPFEHMPCLMEIRPGVGGGEANLFAADLLRMYKAYCARKGFKVSVLKYETADGETDGKGADAPLQEAILEIETDGSYGELRTEAGVHRVQRVPATESKGRTHTSAAAVLVLPSLGNKGPGESLEDADFENPESDYYVNPVDVRTDVMRARGAGGQHVNTTDSAVRLTHIPTGTVVSMQDSRSQHRNREKAWQILRSRIAQARREAREEEIYSLRKSVIGTSRMGRGDKIRTYNWKEQRVTDHRSGVSVFNLSDVMAGGGELDKIVESVKTWMAEGEIEALLAEEAADAEDKEKKKA